MEPREALPDRPGTPPAPAPCPPRLPRPLCRIRRTWRRPARRRRRRRLRPRGRRRVGPAGSRTATWCTSPSAPRRRRRRISMTRMLRRSLRRRQSFGVVAGTLTVVQRRGGTPSPWAMMEAATTTMARTYKCSRGWILESQSAPMFLQHREEAGAGPSTVLSIPLGQD
jgi:hypothetical protein